MKLESITVENYRQFEKAELTFDEGITILAGANNSGKTSLINLIKNIFVDDKLNYNMSDIPAKNMREWVEWVYPIFQKFFRDRKTEENVEKDLLNVVIPKEETDSTHLMKMTTVKIHVSYNPDMDDIKLFADCIMDLDETKHDFYFMYNFEIVHTQFAREIINNFSKIKHRFAEIEEKKSQYAETTDELIINNIQVKERYLKQLIVSLYIQATIPNVYFCDEDYKNKCKFDETKKFRQLFNFCFIKASRPLDDDESDHSHMLSKQMIKMVKMDEKWNELVESLPDEVLKPIQEKEIDKAIRSTSLESLKDTIATLEQTNGGKSGELMLDMQISEEDISDLLQRITTATYDIDGYYLGESSQGLGYSNMIYIHLQLKEYEKNIDPLKVNMFFLEEPESHMHPQMQQVFIKYLLDYYESKLQGLITTHSNEMVRVAGISHLRVIRHVGNFKSELYDLSILVKDLKKSEEMEDKELANFFDWFFEIGYSEIVFADRAIFYEGDTEELKIIVEKLVVCKRYVTAVNIIGHSECEAVINAGCIYKLMKLAGTEESIGVETLDDYAVQKIIGWFQQQEDIDLELRSDIEFIYLPMLDDYSEVRPRALNTRLSLEPEYFCSLIELCYKERNGEKREIELNKSLSDRLYEILFQFKVIPGIDWNGNFDAKRFDYWMKTVKTWSRDNDRYEVAMHTVGSGLSYAELDEDKLPQTAVIEELNRVENEELRRGYYLGIINQRGVHWIDPEGKPELELAEDYENRANIAESRGYSRYAGILRVIGDEFKREAKSNILEAKNGDDE